MPALEIEGRIIRKESVQNGQSARGAWVKQDFILEYQDGNYPAQVCFTSFGNDKVSELGKYGVGDEVKVSFNLRAREYNGRWYNDIRVWRISPASQAGSGQPAYQEPLPAQPPQAPAPSIDDMPADPDTDDLPF